MSGKSLYCGETLSDDEEDNIDNLFNEAVAEILESKFGYASDGQNTRRDVFETDDETVVDGSRGPSFVVIPQDELSSGNIFRLKSPFGFVIKKVEKPVVIGIHLNKYFPKYKTDGFSFPLLRKQRRPIPYNIKEIFADK